MREESFEVAVVGFSVAGVAAALELASLGRNVTLVEHGWDSVVLAGSVLVGPTPLGGLVSGPGFADLAARGFDQLGVAYEVGRTVGALEEDREERQLVLTGAESVARVAAIVFAPSGSAPPAGRWEPLVGHGVSQSAWLDAARFGGATVAVAGGGPRALEEAYLAARWAKNVVVLCPTETLAGGGVLTRVAAENANVEILYRCAVSEVVTDGDGTLREIVCEENGRSRTIAARALFLAGEPVVDWSLFGGEAAARALTDGDRVVLAGVAAGIVPYDHPAQYQDGARAAWAISAV
jgi:thioredoxin reductase (NADPH)